MRVFLVALFIAAFSLTTFAAQPTDPTTAAIFAGGNLTFNGFNTVTGGAIVANGNVLHNGGSLNVGSLYAGGTFTDTGAAFQNSTGDILFGGSIVNMGGPGSVLGGNVTSGGSITFLDSSETITGNVTAAGNVAVPFTFATINGNLLAGGNVSLNGTVGGNLTYGLSLTSGIFSHVNGTTTHGGPVTPTPYAPLTLPAGRIPVPGFTSVTLSNFETRALAPGAYGALTFASGNTVSLTAGQYFFTSIANGFSLNHLSFDTSAGPINIYVAGDLDFNLIQDINGQPLFAGGNPNPLDSQKIFFEVGGNFTGDASIYGTLFAPNGNITLNSFATVTGHVLGGHDVTFNSSGVTLVPEPASLGVIALATLGFLTRRRTPSRS